MSELDENVSMWARLYKRWEKMESDLGWTGTRPAAQVATPLSAMEIELRALRARVDTAFNEATGGLPNKPNLNTRQQEPYRR
jgi:hypothetical protein